MRRLEPLEVPLSGLALIEASAGTGKTHTITTLFVRLLLERRLNVEQILVVTFTKAATAELRDRTRKRLLAARAAFEQGGGEGELGELVSRSRDRRADLAHIERALRSFDQAAIFTIHGFCQRVLSEHAFESGQRFDSRLVSDQRELVRELAEDFWAEQASRATDAELRHAQSSGLGLDRLMRLSHAVAAAPDVELRPLARRTDTAAAVARYLAGREALASVWPGARHEVERTLRDAQTFNQNVHRPERVAGWLEELDALVLRRDATLGGFDGACEHLVPDALARAAKKGKSPPEHAVFELCRELSDSAREAFAELDAWRIGLLHALADRVRSELSRRKDGQGVQSFDDLLHELSRALDGPGGRGLAERLRGRYPAALVDEFQDTDPVQYRIFRSIYLGTDAALFLIGDPKQAIYAFRGADIFSYLRAARDAGGSVYTLAENYRSDPTLVRGVNALFSRAKAPFVLDGIEFSPVEPRATAADRLAVDGTAVVPVEIAFVHWEPGAGREHERIVKDWPVLPGRVAAQVVELLASGALLDGRPLGPGDVAILTRKNRQAFEIQAELRKLGVPSVLLGDQSVFDSQEASDVSMLLGALSAPSDLSLVASALSVGLFGMTADRLAELRDDEAAWEHHVAAFQRWQSLWLRHGFVQAFRAILRDTRAIPRLLGLPDGERKLTNFLHLAELLQRAEVAQHLGMASLRRWLSEVRFDLGKRSEMAPEAQQLRLESDELAVKLTTMHKSKGLEYGVVYCPYLWDGTHVGSDEVFFQYHDPSDALAPRLHLGPIARDGAEHALVETERRAENMRLCYVALTRAKHKTSVLWGPFRTADAAPLATLLHANDPDAEDAMEPGQRVHAAKGDTLERDLGRLVRAAPECFEVVELARTGARTWSAEARELAKLEAREITRRLDSGWRSSSFSALVRDKGALSVPSMLGRDVDEGTADVTPAAASGAEERVVLAAFPRGARAGDALHDLLEHMDFQRSDGEEHEALVAAVLDRHGIDAGHQPALAAAMSQVLETPLLEDPLVRLADVGRRERLVELEFTFPVAGPSGGRLDPRVLARAFAEVPMGLPPGYAESVARLGFAPLEGYLRGFIDLVFAHRGRFYVVDYKSNHLGDHPDDYLPARLEREMAHHHYVLQAHLYTVAVHRFLKNRVPGYSYDSGFGGAVYLFLRGMAPERGSRTGVHFHRPPRERIELLSSVLGEEPAGRGA